MSTYITVCTINGEVSFFRCGNETPLLLMHSQPSGRMHALSFAHAHLCAFLCLRSRHQYHEPKPVLAVTMQVLLPETLVSSTEKLEGIEVVEA